MRTFAISPRTRDPDRAWPDMDRVVRLAARYGFTGVLAHTGNDTLVDPWLVAQHALDVSPVLRPLVAVNPVYHHPFAVAQLAASLSYRYERQLFLNLVAGTSTPDRLALGDETEHDRRYDRLAEFGSIVLGLLGSPAPVTVTGEFYRLRAARLSWPGPPQLRPVPFIAGHSSGARLCAARLGAVRIGMLAAAPPAADGPSAVYAALLARGTDEEAWAVARARYPADDELVGAGAAALRYTDAQWRRDAFAEDARTDPAWFWTAPMRSLRADCPFAVGSVETLAEVVAGHLRAGVHDFVLDLPPDEADFHWAAQVLDRAGRLAKAVMRPAP